MNNRLLVACFALAALHNPHDARAQFTDAHSYDNTPVGISQLELAYTYVHANASLDTSLVIGARALAEARATLVGAVYEIGSGRVRFLD